mgnify:CR=1 FL=1
MSTVDKYEQERLTKLSPQYPNFKTSFQIKDVLKRYDDLFLNDTTKHSGLKLSNETFKISGRVIAIRKASKNLYFMTIQSDGKSIQIVSNYEDYLNKSNFITTSQINRGDIVGIEGFLGTTKVTEKVINGNIVLSGGETSLYALDLILLVPCLRLLTTEHIGFTDINSRVKQRYLDMILNPHIISTLKTRSNIISTIRNYLQNNDFIEVQTPILTSKVGGANAEPFETYHNALKQKMFMRIAPELYLKQLIIGGLDRVYEIGSQFRNEDIDSTHVPEFTSIEFYMSNADYDTMMDISQDMLTNIVKRIYPDLQVPYNNKIIDFSKFNKINILDELTKQTNTIFPADLSTKEALLFLDDLCIKNSVLCASPRTANRLLDKLIGHYIEPQCHNPTFLIGHPMIMSPLAKANKENCQIADRFELFVNCFEIANAYTEQNDPKIQLMQFSAQQEDKDKGDVEASVPDTEYIEALKYGLPPTGGFGMGIDRLVMLLTNNINIREVIAFPPTTSI